LEGAICSSGTSSPVVGNRYRTMLWWLISRSSSTRIPVVRNTSTTAQAQNAMSSSVVRSRRLPVVGSSAQTLSPVVRVTVDRVSDCPAAVKLCPGRVCRAEHNNSWVARRRSATLPTSSGSTGSPFAGAGVHSCLTMPSQFALVDLLAADGAGSDPSGPARGILDRPLGEVEVEGPHRGQALPVADPFDGDGVPLTGVGVDGLRHGAQAPFHASATSAGSRKLSMPG
jgi:hypothetical protein